MRPEKLALSGAGEGHADQRNRLVGEIRRVSFLGNVVRYAVKIGASTYLTVDTPNLTDGFRPNIGDEVAVAWPVADSSIVGVDAK